jgi:hypothetical protein
MPERSRLFVLPHVEASPDQRESLMSLLIRTCGAHQVNPRRLIGAVVSVALPEIEKLAYPAFFNRLAGTINGLGPYADLFVRAMEQMTGQQALRSLTLLPWKDFFPLNGQGALARHPRWCSACLLEQRRSREDVYFPLLWSLEPYRVCTVHGRPLDDLCPHCGKRQPFISRYPDQAVCHHCLRSLIHLRSPDAESEPSGGNQFETWVANALGSMLAQHDNPGFAPSAEHFRSAVQSMVESVAGGNRAAFCRSVGFNRYALKGWLSKGERPSITQFLALSYAVQTKPADLVSIEVSWHGAQDNFLRAAGGLKIRHRCPTVTKYRRSELRSRLQAQLQAEPPQPISVIAQSLGLTARYLRYWFPEMCAHLTLRHKKSVRRRSMERMETQGRRVQEIVRAFRDGNRYPSRRNVDKFLRENGASLGNRVLFKVYREALAA